MKVSYRLGGFAAVMAVSASAMAHERPPPGAADASAQPPSAAAAVAVIQRVCLPMIDGGNLSSAAKGVGMKWTHGAWVLKIDRRRRVELTPPDPANPDVCDVTIIHALGAAPAIERAIDAWASAASPRLTPVPATSGSPRPGREHPPRV